MSGQTRLVFTTLALLLSTALNAEDTLKFSYWTKAHPPFVFRDGNQLSGGIIKDLGDALASSLGRTAAYVELPSKRIEPYLISGKLDIDCITNPIWKDTPDAFRWSPVLFDGADRFLVRSGKENDIQDLYDLRGKILGIYQGYVYSEALTQMIDSKEVATTQVSDVEKGIYLLGLKRIDALVEFGVILDYHLKNMTKADEFSIANLPADQYKLHCAYSHKINADYQDIDNAFRTMIDSGTVTQILNKYR